EAYSTVLSNNLNRIMKFLTSMTIILTIPTIISSIYGMNVGLPLQENPAAFFYIIFLILVMSSVMVVVFIRKGWI
ncbi:MAG: magnesium transporter CorA family protein, partial [Candidatus Aenigmatarchaeota archaeon]